MKAALANNDINGYNYFNGLLTQAQATATSYKKLAIEYYEEGVINPLLEAKTKKEEEQRLALDEAETDIEFYKAAYDSYKKDASDGVKTMFSA